MPYKDKENRRKVSRESAARKRQSRSDQDRREYFLKTRYGITSAEWDRIFEKQGFRCAICQTDTPKSKVGWHTDHDHNSGKVRGILCEHCNRGLGMFADDISFLRRASNYLGLSSGVFSGNEIQKRSIISPFEERTRLSGRTFGKSYAGYDVRLDQDVELAPRDFKLGSTVEYFDMPLDCVGMVSDKSTNARKGLSLFNTIIEPGWRGYLTLEMVNLGNEHLSFRRGDPIAQIVFMGMVEPAEKGYDGKYQDQGRGPQEAILEPDSEQ